MSHDTIMNQGIRLTIAFVASALIMFVYYTYIAPPLPPQQVNNTEIVQTQGSDSSGNLQPKSTMQVSVVNQNETLTKNETVAIEKNITIETPVSKIILSTKGGVLTSYDLNDYSKTAESDSEKMNLLTETPHSSALFLGFKGYSAFTANKVFEVASDENLDHGARKIVLAWQNSDVRIEKTFVFDGGTTPYAVSVNYALVNLTDHEMTLSPFVETSLTQKDETNKKYTGMFAFLNYFMSQQADHFNRVFFRDQKLDADFNWEKFQGAEAQSGNITWAALSDRYFIFAMIPTTMNPMTNVYFDRKDDLLTGRLFDQETVLNAHEKLSGSFLSYIGPKKHSEMNLMNVALEKSVDYGWFSILAVPILWLMTFLHKFIPNWGLVILALTFIIKILLHPVNKKSMVSMKGMQQLQPKLKEIKDKFANDKDKQNQAMMQLFRTHKVNPMSGCLPMFLQMPIYIVLYKVLWNAIELYHAPFFGFYKDLSAPDPYFILPILLGVFMVLQQKLTPAATTDPAQQKMMMMMPLFFSVFLLFLPMGLVLYILVNTVMSVIQQFMIKRDLSLKDFMTGKWQEHEAT